MAPPTDPSDSAAAAFERLPAGRTERSPEETASHQRRRLTQAIVELVHENGYPATTLREVVALAGVSNTAFYRHFDSLQDCFLAAVDQITEEWAARIGAAFFAGEGFPGRLEAAIAAYVEMLIAEPAKTHFVLVDLLSLGEAGSRHVQKGAEGFEAMLTQNLSEAPGGAAVDAVTIRAIVAGFQRVCFRRVRAGEAERLREESALLIGWAISYRRPDGPRRPGLRAVGGAELGDVWEEEAGASAPDRRERIIRAAATVVGERGYDALSIPAITRMARISNETFYANFDSAHAAFLAGIDDLGARVMAAIAAEFRPGREWAASVEDGLEILLGYLAANPLLARLPFFGTLAAGPEAMSRVDLMLDALVERFELDTHPGPDGGPLDPVLVEAIGGAVYMVVQREIATGGVTRLPELLGELSFVVLAPYGEA